MATNMPVTSSVDVSPVTVSRITRPVTLFSPRTSTGAALVTNRIFAFALARSSMMRDARNSSRRCTTVTLRAKRVRKVASSIAESPPPTTTMSWSLKKKPSQVAQALTPRPSRLLFTRNAQVAGCGAHCQHDGVRLVGLAVHDDLLDRAGEVEFLDVLGADVGAEALGLLAHLVHQVGAHDSLTESGEVLDLGGGHEGATELGPLELQRFEFRARGVDGSGVSGRSRNRR